MAKCDLTIRLDEPEAVYTGGDVIRGVVMVDVDGDVHCGGLVVGTAWRTHGKGNVTKGDVESETLFEGEWSAGERHEYPFELTVGDWPPTYHGHFINVDHYVDARAKIAWAFDPKASVPFAMRPATDRGGKATDNAAVQAKTLAIVIVAGTTLPFLVIPFLVGGPLAWVVLALFTLVGVPVGLAFWLPRWRLGEVEAATTTDQFFPGQDVTGTLVVRPKRDVRINGITATLTGREVCVSGSGSNSKTHKHELHERETRLADASTLRPMGENAFGFSLPIPPDAATSFDVRSNKVEWATKIRVDIPRWPDWRKTLPIRVVAGVASPDGSDIPAGHPSDGHPSDGHPSDGHPSDGHPSDGHPRAGSTSTASPPAGGEITFAETAKHLAAAGDAEQRDLLLSAIDGLEFDFAATIDRRLLYSGDDDPFVDRHTHAVWADHADPPLPLVLYVPESLADEFEQHGRRPWSGRGRVVGWDDRHGRLRMKLVGWEG